MVTHAKDRYTTEEFDQFVLLPVRDIFPEESP
jgi:hypothetical protein